MKWEKSANSRSRKGFTIVEVVIVLAITGLIFVGAVAGIGSSLARQRFNDATQNFAQTLRTQYDQISRVQISSERDNSMCDYVYGASGTFNSETKRGRTDCNIYGVAVILGADGGHLIQSTTLLGKDLPTYRNILKENEQLYKVSDVDAYLSSMPTLQLLGELGVSNYYGKHLTSDDTSMTNCQVTNILTHENILWSATLEKPNGTTAKYIILIVRSPRDGTIHTYYKDISNVSEVTNYRNYDISNCRMPNNDEDILRSLKKTTPDFEVGDLNLCLNSEDVGSATGVRRTIKLAADGHGSAAVELVNVDVARDGDDSYDNICAKCDEGVSDPRCQ